MFYRAKSFNQSIDKWDTSRVENMNYMFSGAKSFNQPIDKWDTSRVENMNYMFDGATSKARKMDNKSIYYPVDGNHKPIYTKSKYDI